jgi:hypothetical protein
LIRQDLLLVLYNRLLVSYDPGLIAEQQLEPILIPQDLLLIRNDRPIVCDDRLLILERRLCHCVFLCWPSMSCVIAPLIQWRLRPCRSKAAH